MLCEFTHSPNLYFLRLIRLLLLLQMYPSVVLYWLCNWISYSISKRQRREINGNCICSIANLNLMVFFRTCCTALIHSLRLVKLNWWHSVVAPVVFDLSRTWSRTLLNSKKLFSTKMYISGTFPHRRVWKKRRGKMRKEIVLPSSSKQKGLQEFNLYTFSKQIAAGLAFLC